MASFGPTGGEEDEENASEDCWTFQDNPEISRAHCCEPPPCGQHRCWAPPEFTFAFCCRSLACSPSVLGDIQQSLDLAVSALRTASAANATADAFRSAPGAFRAMLRGELHGLRLTVGAAGARQSSQSCNCALAYAAALLLEPGGLTSNAARHALAPRWFTEGIRWSELVAEGWGGIFALLAFSPVRNESNVEAIPGFKAYQGRLSTPGIVASMESANRHENALDLFLDDVQAKVRGVAHRLADLSSGWPELVRALRALGTWGDIWRQVERDYAERRAGRKCSSVGALADGSSRWGSCSRWAYGTADTDFSSPGPLPPSRPLEKEGAAAGGSDVAVCVLGAPRGVIDTYGSLRAKVVDVLKADAFVYVPFPGKLSRALETQLELIGSVVTAIAAPDVDGPGMQERLVSELHNQRFLNLYSRVPGPWRAPVFGQMGSSMWGYHNQHVCKQMVEAYEKQRGRLYNWVVFARADLLWVHTHPPLDVFDSRYVYVPYGQDNSHYNHGPELGINDRHAVVPRHLVDAYFGRWGELQSGEAWDYLEDVAEKAHPINTEQYLLIHLRAHRVPVLRFPPVGFLVHCAEGPQCERSSMTCIGSIAVMKLDGYGLPSSHPPFQLRCLGRHLSVTSVRRTQRTGMWRSTALGCRRASIWSVAFPSAARCLAGCGRFFAVVCASHDGACFRHGLRQPSLVLRGFALDRALPPDLRERSHFADSSASRRRYAPWPISASPVMTKDSSRCQLSCPRKGTGVRDRSKEL
mmetsp:Transcript_68354/g.221148  ORF Transcript_68354/g.221148 Transcript_68354/m.221148 type:complete len:754 (-) Transcript_68354:79-2340(-)